LRYQLRLVLTAVPIPLTRAARAASARASIRPLRGGVLHRRVIVTAIIPSIRPACPRSSISASCKSSSHSTLRAPRACTIAHLRFGSVQRHWLTDCDPNYQSDQGPPAARDSRLDQSACPARTAQPGHGQWEGCLTLISRRIPTICRSRVSAPRAEVVISVREPIPTAYALRLPSPQHDDVAPYRAARS